jgi:hypothetical protein
MTMTHDDPSTPPRTPRTPRTRRLAQNARPEPETAPESMPVACGPLQQAQRGQVSDDQEDEEKSLQPPSDLMSIHELQQMLAAEEQQLEGELLEYEVRAKLLHLVLVTCKLPSV